MHPWIGTSGFQYKEWKGSFYPEDLSTAKMLPYYAERLDTTEVNYTFRSMPKPKAIQNWDAQTPARFKFSLKAPQKVTHFAKLRNCGETVAYFHGVISALGEKLGPVLFQLPATFHADAALLEDFLAGLPAGFRAAFEFRHESWFGDAIYEALRKHGAALCIAESEELATPFVVTAPFGYLRPRREDYTGPDLKRWAKFVGEQSWTESFTYFKHEETGVGPKFAAQFQKLLASV